MPTLVLLRHGKSDYPTGVADHDRPLNDRGRREAALLGDLITAAIGPAETVDLVLVSSATRAQQTWEQAASSLAASDVVTEPGLYLADVSTLVTRIAALPDHCDVVVIVGHNDGLESAAGELTQRDITLKTSTFAVLSSAEPWHRWTSSRVTANAVVAAR